MFSAKNQDSVNQYFDLAKEAFYTHQASQAGKLIVDRKKLPSHGSAPGFKVLTRQGMTMNEYISEFPALTTPTIEMFPEGISGVVTKPITLYQPGRVKCQGVSWRAKLYKPNCQTRLLSGQPVIAIGRENLTYIVIPLHCLLEE